MSFAFNYPTFWSTSDKRRILKQVSSTFSYFITATQLTSHTLHKTAQKKLCALTAYYRNCYVRGEDMTHTHAAFPAYEKSDYTMKKNAKSISLDVTTMRRGIFPYTC